MRSLFKKIIIIALALLMALFMFSCSEESDIPEGMQIASPSDVPFVLYVPTNWAVNYGTSMAGATLSSGAGIGVTADHFSADENETLDDFVSASIDEYKSVLEGFELIKEPTQTSLDKRAAQEIRFSAKHDGMDYAFMRIFVKYEDSFVVFSYRAGKDYFDTYFEEVQSMIDVFKLCAPQSAQPNVTDDETPDGMKIASGENVEYRLYVPLSWVVDAEETVALAYVSESDRSNVSLTSYSPKVSMSIDEYFTLCEKEYEKIYEGYDREETVPEIQMAGKLARDYRFSFEHNGEKYQSRQVICIYRNMFYIMTYTAKAESFELHMADVEKIISEIKFR